MTRLSAEQRGIVFAHPAGWIATGFGSGLSPVAPGTAGSLAALLPWLALRQLPIFLYITAIVATFALGVWACGWVVHRLHIADPGYVVWDEFVGQWIALTWVPRDWRWMLAGFLLFRIFDICKPWPISWADRQIGGGFGVMLDDVIAGIYAALVLFAIAQFL